MLKRLIKILTNKPTEIKKPVFTKYFERENQQIKDLQELLKKSDGDSKKFIEQDLKKLKYGQIGENNVYYELKNSFIPMICLHNIRLKYKEMTAQIDFLAITSKYIYVIECKNLVGDITINEEGEFIRYRKNVNGKVVSKEGMYSPIVQNERHINVLKEILREELKYNKTKLKRVESLVVTANPKTIINKKNAPKEISDKIIRHDHIIDKIHAHENDKNIDWVFIEEDMRIISETLIKFHKECKIDYDKKYNISSHKKSANKSYKNNHHNYEDRKHGYSKNKNHKNHHYEHYKVESKVKGNEELRRILESL